LVRTAGTVPRAELAADRQIRTTGGGRGILRQEDLAAGAVLHDRSTERRAVFLAVERGRDGHWRHAGGHVDTHLTTGADRLRQNTLFHENELARCAGRIRVLVEVVRGVRRPSGAGEWDSDAFEAGGSDDQQPAGAATTGTGALRVPGASDGAHGDVGVLSEMDNLVPCCPGGRVLDEDLLPEDELVRRFCREGAQRDDSRDD